MNAPYNVTVSDWEWKYFAVNLIADVGQLLIDTNIVGHQGQPDVYLSPTLPTFNTLRVKRYSSGPISLTADFPAVGCVCTILTCVKKGIWYIGVYGYKAERT